MKVVPLHVCGVTEGRKPVVCRAGRASGASVVGSVNEHALLIRAFGMVIDDFAGDDEAMCRML